jgi:hypothetical protein
MNYDTTRTFSRSLSQAFADERAHCIECPPKKNYGDKAVNWTLAFAIWFLITLIAMGY